MQTFMLLDIDLTPGLVATVRSQAAQIERLKAALATAHEDVRLRMAEIAALPVEAEHLAERWDAELVDFDPEEIF